MAKAVRKGSVTKAEANKGHPPRRPITPQAAEGGNYFIEVKNELIKVVWPTWEELFRMTGIVIITVIIFASLIGIADFVLGLVVKPLYTTSTHFIR